MVEPFAPRPRRKASIRVRF